MKYDVLYTEQFEKDLYYYVKKKKYRHIKDDIQDIISDLQNGNLVGDELEGIHLKDNNSAYKVRAINSDTKGGKSNGYRIIYYVVKNDAEIYMLSIYYKKDDIKVLSDEQILGLIETYCEKDSWLFKGPIFLRKKSIWLRCSLFYFFVVVVFGIYYEA